MSAHAEDLREVIPLSAQPCFRGGVAGGEIRFAAVLEADTQNRFRYEDHAYTNRDMLIAEMKDLHLLLQAASGDGETWGGSGVVYFWIRRQDLEARRFDRAFAKLQTT